jgi:hypothetical protein
MKSAITGRSSSDAVTMPVSNSDGGSFHPQQRGEARVAHWHAIEIRGLYVDRA